MNVWLAVAIGLLPALLAAVIAVGRGGVSRRLVAVQFASSLTVFELVLLDFAFAQPSSFTLVLALALMSVPGTLVLVLFRERWL